MDVIIKNGKVVTPESVIEASLGIEKGKIVAITKGEELNNAGKIIDAKGNYVLPGVVDEHVHLQDMQRSEIDEFVGGSTGAAIGGVTTVMEQPLTIPSTTTLQSFEEKKAVAEKKFIVDFALYGGAVPNNFSEIPKMAAAGACGFKAMMAGSVPGVFEMMDDGALFETFRTVAECDSVITVHAENDAIINFLEKKFKEAGKKDMQAFFASRPVYEEVEAISRAILLAHEANCRLHILHVSCSRGIDLISRKKFQGYRLTCESGPHYLVLNQDDAKRLGPYLKFAPPARSKEDTEKMWQRLAEGKIDTLGSDHGAHTKEMKEKGWQNIWEAGNGALGIETMLPVMLSEGVNKNRISINKLVSVICENPAKIFGIYPQKGTIQLGSDADIVIVDMNKEYVINADKFHTKQKHSPFNGMKIKGIPILTMVRGEVVMEDGKVIGKPGYGKFVKPSK